MQDKILVIVAMGALILFCGIVIYFVAEPDLSIITTLVLLLAVHDFWISLFRAGSGAAAGTAPALEDRPGGVSGKTLTSAKDDFARKSDPKSKKNK